MKFVIIMSLDLTNLVHDFGKLIYSFIATEKIDVEKVEEIEELINEIEVYKKNIIKFDYEKKELIKIFSGLNLIKNFFKKSKEHLLIGAAKRENPKSAKDIYQFQNEIVLLANYVDSYKIKPVADMSNRINSTSLYLRERLRTEELYPAINEIINPNDKETKEITHVLMKKVGL